MTSISTIAFEINGKKVSFKMTFDQANLCDRALMQELQRVGCCEPEVVHLMVRAVRPGDFVIDGGANIGFFTMLLAQLVGDTGRVLACEPGQNNVWKLEENIRANQFKNVEIEQRPLWSRSEKVRLYMCDDGTKNALSQHSLTKGSAEIEAATLDEYAEGARKPSFLKLDIEGAEEHALRGADSLLEHCSYVVAEMNAEAMPKLGSSFESLRDFMHERGFSPFFLHESGALPTYIPRHTRIDPHDARANTTRLNLNILYSTFESVSKAWPEAGMW